MRQLPILLWILSGVLIANPGLHQVDPVSQSLRVITTRIKMDLVHNPVMYLDEPASAYMGNIVATCDNLLDQLNAVPQNVFIVNTLIIQLQKDLWRLKSLKYDLVFPVKEPATNIRINYFSVSEP